MCRMGRLVKKKKKIIKERKGNYCLEIEEFQILENEANSYVQTVKTVYFEKNMWYMFSHNSS